MSSDTVKAALTVIKEASTAVLTAESAAPAGSTGADKLDLAKSALESVYPALGFADVAFESIWPLIKPFIDTLVAKFKKVGTAPAASAPVAAEPVAQAVAIDPPAAA